MIIKKESKGQMYDIIIDDEDYEKVSKHKWSISHQSNTKYCQGNIKIDGKRKKLRLHRFLMGLENEDKRIINHIDGNGLNNQKSNLEICDQKYNTQSINTKNNFGCIYIRKDRPKKKYRAAVVINSKRFQKLFYTREDAQAYLDDLKEFAIAEIKPFN